MPEKFRLREISLLSKQEKWLICLGWLLLLSFVALVLHGWVCLDHFALCGSNMSERLNKAQIKALSWGEPEHLIAEKTVRDFRGELFHMVGWIVVQITGPSFRSFLAANAFFLLIYILAVGWLGCMAGGAWAGLLAATLGGLTPMVIWHVRAVNHDLPVAAMSLLALAALLKTVSFANWRWSLVFGVLLGLALLAKITAPAYLLPAIAAGFLLGFLPAERRRGIRLRSRLFGLTLAVAAGALVAAPWYAPRLPILWQEWIFHLGRPDSPTFQSVAGDSIGTLLPRVVGLVLLPLFILAVPLSIVRRTPYAPVLFSFFCPVFLFLLVKPTGFERFMMAPIGAMAVLVAATLVSRKKPRINGYFTLIVFGCCLNFFLISQRGVSAEASLVEHLTQTPTCSEFDNYDPAVETIRQLVGEKEAPVIVFLSQAPEAWFQADTWNFLIHEAVPAAQINAIDSIHARHYRDYVLTGEAMSEADLFIYHSPVNGPKWPNAEQFDDQPSSFLPEDGPYMEKRCWIYENVISPTKQAFQLERILSQWYLRGNMLIYFYRRRPAVELPEWRVPPDWRIPTIDNTRLQPSRVQPGGRKPTDAPREPATL